MSVPPPKIDPRTRDQIVEKLEDLAEGYTDWQPDDENMDAGGALIRVFAHMIEAVIDRLNQVPEKNFRAFLNMLGAHVRPPHAARVPVTFSLAKGSPDTGVRIPARTRVAAMPLENEKSEIVFETDEQVWATTAGLSRVLTHVPGDDFYAEYSALPEDGMSIDVFNADIPLEHSLYIACDEAFLFPGQKEVTISIHLLNDVSLLRSHEDIIWSIWGGTTWTEDLNPDTQLIGSELQVTFEDMPVPAVTTVDGVDGAWLRATLPSPLTNCQDLLEIEISHIEASVDITDSELGAPLLGFTNSRPVDFVKGFYPFGERPATNDTLYLALHPHFAKDGAAVTIDVNLAHDAQSGNPVIKWEAWVEDEDDEAKGEWIELGVATGVFTQGDPQTLTFSGPKPISMCEIGGEIGYWLRARLSDGDFGSGLSYEPNLTTDAQGNTVLVTAADGSVLFVQATEEVIPPFITSVKLTYTYSADQVSMSSCYALNGFDCANYDEQVNEVEVTSFFEPFAANLTESPALYLGFDGPLPVNLPVNLFFQIESFSGEVSLSDPVRLVWEYSVIRDDLPAWENLSIIQDGTKSMSEPGLVTFIGPANLVERREFGRELRWLRVRWDGGEYLTRRDDGEYEEATPRARGVLVNTVWASQAITIVDEVLGSSDGSPDQGFYTSQWPVLQDQQIEIWEREQPPDAAREAIEQLEGTDAISIVTDASGQPREVWVRWHAVNDFHGSGPWDRHYVFDHINGEVRFGDGQRGMIPQQTRGNIRARRYRVGGGKQGNRPAHQITQPKSALPYVDSVTNHFPAESGANQETVGRAMERESRRLRHRERAVTVQDFEDLAREASPAVARAHAIGAESQADAGNVKLIIVPDSQEAKPEPTSGLINLVEQYVLQHCIPTLNLCVEGPDWIDIGIIVEVAPASQEVVDSLETSVRLAVANFLHPLTGGSEGGGWALGRRPYASDLYALIESVEGVDYVYSLVINIDDSTLTDTTLIHASTIDVKLVIRDL